MATLNVFEQDVFGVVSLTDSINNLPFVPGRAGQIIDWNERGINTTTVMIEEREGILQLLNPSPRGGTGDTTPKIKRRARSLLVPHYQHDDAITADEVQNVRAFGQETEVESVMTLVEQRMQDAINLVLDPTLEYQRLGAVKGQILNADGSILYDLFDEFGVTQEAAINFDLSNSNPASGALRKKCAGVVRTIANNLRGVSFSGVHAFCGDDFFDALLSFKEVVNSYLSTPMAQVLREGYVYPNGNKVYGAFEFGGIVWENYRGMNGADPMVAANECHIFPVGVPGLFRTVFAPADYIEAVNTVGQPRYAKQWRSENGKRINMEAQSNPLSYCTRPTVLLKGTA